MSPRRFALLGLAAAALTACGSSGPSAGHVLAKQYQPGYQYVLYIPIYRTICEPVGSSESCFTVVASMIPYIMQQPEDWRLELTAKKSTGWTYVSQAQFDRARIGQWWGSRNPQRPAAIKLGEKAPA